jgi:hypothetical protein
MQLLPLSRGWREGIACKNAIGTASELACAIHKIGRVGKFPCPERIESCLECINPASLLRTCLSVAEQLVNRHAVSFACHAKFPNESALTRLIINTAWHKEA